MFTWKKHGLILSPQTIPNRPAWMDSFAQAPNSIIYDDFVRVFFSTRPQPNEQKQFVSNSAFVDLKRSNIKEIIRTADAPILPLGPLGSFDEFGIYPATALRDDDGKILVYYGGWTRCESVPFNVSIGMAISQDDGATYQKFGKGPILSFSPDEPFVVASPKIRKYNNTYYLFYIAGRKWFTVNDRAEIIYKIRMATSTDGIHWTKHNHDLIADVLGDDEAQACPDVIYKNGVYHMFFCYRAAVDFRENKSCSYRIGYARSHDLVTWERRDELMNFDVSETGWDSEMVSYPHILDLDDKIYMFYLGNGVGRDGFGLAELIEGDLS